MIPASPPYPVATPAPALTGDQKAWLASGIAGIAGGSTTASVVVGQLPLMLSGRSGLPGDVMVLLGAQLLFGLGVVLVAYLLAPGQLARRLLGSGIFLAGVIVTLATATLRVSGALPMPRMLWPFLNPYGVLLLAGAAGWLVACGARALAYLTLLATIVISPLNWVLLRSAAPSSLASTATLGLCLLIAVGVLIVSRPSRR